MALEPAETQHRKIVAKTFTRHNSDSTEVSSISEAISWIKEREEQTKPATNKIVLDEEVVYFSEKHGEVANWESEWKRQKVILSLDEDTRDCPHGINNCYEVDLCMDCQLDKAAGQYE